MTSGPVFTFMVFVEKSFIFVEKTKTVKNKCLMGCPGRNKHH
jgi:hypothetical protein